MPKRSDALEQCSLTGGRHNSFAISVFLILPASSRDSPLTRSVINELEAIADPQPNVLNLTSEIMPLSSTRICSFITSPQLVHKKGWLLVTSGELRLTQVRQRVLYRHQCRFWGENRPIRKITSNKEIIRYTHSITICK